MIDAVEEPGPDWTIIGGEDNGDPPCPRCGAEDAQRVRKRRIISLQRWLISGGPLFAHVRECGACGYRWPGVVFFGAPDARRWLLPWRVARAAVAAFHQQRTSYPVPWLYLASAGLGAAAGGGLGAVGGRPGRGAALGAATGSAACWSVFASTAVRQYGTATAIADAVLVHVGDPQRNAERHARREEEQAAAAGFLPYGLDGTWQGRRYLAGAATSWGRGRQRPRVTELSLGHATGDGEPGAPGWDEGITVATLAPPGTGAGYDHRWDRTTDELFDVLSDEFGRRGAFEPRGAEGSAVQRRAVVVLLDGTAVDAVSLHGGDRWVVVVHTPDTHVEVRGTGPAVPDDLRLERVRDLITYPALRPTAGAGETSQA